jgi:hypothetical protein
VARLDAVDELRETSVLRLRPFSARTRLEHDAGAGHGAPEERVAAQPPRQRREVARAGDVCRRRCRSDRRSGCERAQLAGARVHVPHERGARAGDALGERDGGVVGGFEQQPAQQVGDGQSSPARRPSFDSTASGW